MATDGERGGGGCVDGEPLEHSRLQHGNRKRRTSDGFLGKLFFVYNQPRFR